MEKKKIQIKYKSYLELYQKYHLNVKKYFCGRVKGSPCFPPVGTIGLAGPLNSSVYTASHFLGRLCIFRVPFDTSIDTPCGPFIYIFWIMLLRSNASVYRSHNISPKGCVPSTKLSTSVLQSKMNEERKQDCFRFSWAYYIKVRCKSQELFFKKFYDFWISEAKL